MDLDFSGDPNIKIKLVGLVALVVGVFSLTCQVSRFCYRLESVEKAIQGRWTFEMNREAWRQAEILNPGFIAPKVSEIRSEYGWSLP